VAEQKMARVWVKIPDLLLESFDREITPLYLTRNDAIRNSMIQMMNDARKLKREMFYRRIKDERVGER